MHDPIVSIITPVFRSEDILARALGSLLAQDLREWEAILVDDGSPEQSWRVIKAYSWIDPRIRSLQQKHGGACAARNTGISEARGKYLLFLDADDWLEPDALSTLTGACESNGWEAAHARLRYVTPDGLPTQWEGGYAGEAPLFEAMSWSNVLSVPSSVFLNRSILDQIGLFDPTLAHCGDWDLWARLARHDGAVGRVDRIVTGYRMRPGSLSRNPRTLLRDATTVLTRIHNPDPRVLRPKESWAGGNDPAQLATRIAHFGVYATGLAVASGGYAAAEAVLDAVPKWTELSPQRAGEYLFYSMCFARCVGPESMGTFWPEVLEPVQKVLAELERRTRTPGLAGRISQVMDACTEERLSAIPLPLPEPLDESPKPPPEPPPAPYGTVAHDRLQSLARHEK